MSAAPLATITGSNTGLDGGNDACSPTGTIYAVNGNVSTSTEYAASPSGTLNETPIVTLAGTNTGRSGPTAVAIH